MSKVKTNAIAAGEPLADETPSTSAPLAVPVPQVSATPVPVATPPAPSPPPANPLRPGLETPPVSAPDENPFTLLSKWEKKSSQDERYITHGNLRALEVPGGCLIKSAFSVPGFMGESLCFVPGVRIGEVGTLSEHGSVPPKVQLVKA